MYLNFLLFVLIASWSTSCFSFIADQRCVLLCIVAFWGVSWLEFWFFLICYDGFQSHCYVLISEGFESALFKQAVWYYHIILSYVKGWKSYVPSPFADKSSQHWNFGLKWMPCLKIFKRKCKNCSSKNVPKLYNHSKQVPFYIAEKHNWRVVYITSLLLIIILSAV